MICNKNSRFMTGIMAAANERIIRPDLTTPWRGAQDRVYKCKPGHIAYVAFDEARRREGYYIFTAPAGRNAGDERYTHRREPGYTDPRTAQLALDDLADESGWRLIDYKEDIA
jgi:hypothetical protein